MLPFEPAELFIALTWGLAVAVLVVARGRWRQRSGTRARLAALDLGPTRVPGRTVWSPDLRSSVTALGSLAGTRLRSSLQRLTQLIDSNGLAGNLAPAEILGWKLVLAAVGLVIALAVYMTNGIAGLWLVPVLVAVGWSGPTFWLRSRRRARVGQIVRDLPTVIDLLALSLEAGMGLDRALGIICDRVQSPLSAELQHVLRDIGLGISRQEAFVRLSERIRNDDVRLLSSSIIQSEQLGTSLVTTVTNQGRLLRIARRRRAETQALRAPVKMLFPMVLFILPTLFLFVLGPPALNMSRALAQGHP